MNPIPFTNQYLTLGDKFYVKTRPIPVAAPALIKFNKALADDMGLSADDLASQDGVNIFVQLGPFLHHLTKSVYLELRLTKINATIVINVVGNVLWALMFLICIEVLNVSCVENVLISVQKMVLLLKRGLHEKVISNFYSSRNLFDGKWCSSGRKHHD